MQPLVFTYADHVYLKSTVNVFIRHGLVLVHTDARVASVLGHLSVKSSSSAVIGFANDMFMSKHSCTFDLRQAVEDIIRHATFLRWQFVFLDQNLCKNPYQSVSLIRSSS